MGHINIRKKDTIGIIEISREKHMNSFCTEVLQDLDTAIDRIEADRSVGTLIITGAGQRAFAAGADIAEMKGMFINEVQNYIRQGQKLFGRIECLNKPVVAAVNGFALGGGCELAMACDIRLASENAKFGFPEVSLGVIPGWGGTQRLSGIIGKSKAMKLILAGEIIDSREAFRLGLADIVVPQEKLMEEAFKLCERIGKNAPVAVGAAKKAVNQAYTGKDGFYAQEAALFCECFLTNDKDEGMSAFLEKRKALFHGD